MNIKQEIGRMQGRQEIIFALQKFVQDHDETYNEESHEILCDLNQLIKLEIAKNSEVISL